MSLLVKLLFNFSHSFEVSLGSAAFQRCILDFVLFAKIIQTTDKEFD